MLDFTWWIVLFLGIGVTGAGLYWLWQRTRVQRQCLYCGATDLVEIDRETLQTRTVEIVSGGAMAGGDVRLQLDQEVRYSCKSCGKTSKFRVTTTN